MVDRQVDNNNSNSDLDYQGMTAFTRRHAFFIKIVALAVLFVFTWQQITWAQGAPAPVWQHAKTPLQKDYLNIPYASGKIEHEYINGSEEVIINIQDAHASLSAQESIVNLLDSLVANYDLNLVAVEGSQGYIDTSILRTIPGKDSRRDTAGYLMKKGKMSAGEFFAVTSENDIALYGIEDNKLYKANVDSFRKTIEKREECLANVEALQRALTNLEEKIYSESLREFNKAAKEHKEGKLGFSKYWEVVSKLAKEKRIDPAGHTNITKLLTSLELEKKIDFKRANSERKDLIDELSSILVKQELEALVLKSLSFKKGDISQAEFHQYLISLAENKEIDPKPYENLIGFTQYISVYESIDILSLYHEVETLEEAIREKLYRNSDERTLYSLQEKTRILKGLFNVALSNGDVDYIIKNRSEFKAEEFASFIKGSYKKHSLAIEGGYDLTLIIESMDEAVNFYNIAKKRDEEMLKNTLKRMREENKKVAALITGGFHTEGLADLMKSKGLSYMVVMPKYAEEKERPYIAILTGKTAGYQELIKKGEYELAVHQYLSTGKIGDLLDSVVYEFRKARTDRELENKRKDWAGRYSRAYDAFPKDKEGKLAAGRITPDEFEEALSRITPDVLNALKDVEDEDLESGVIYAAIKKSERLRAKIEAKRKETGIEDKFDLALKRLDETEVDLTGINKKLEKYEVREKQRSERRKAHEEGVSSDEGRQRLQAIIARANEITDGIETGKVMVSNSSFDHVHGEILGLKGELEVVTMDLFPKGPEETDRIAGLRFAAMSAVVSAEGTLYHTFEAAYREIVGLVEDLERAPELASIVNPSELREEFGRLSDAEIWQRYEEIVLKYCVDQETGKAAYEKEEGGVKTPSELHYNEKLDIFKNIIFEYTAMIERLKRGEQCTREEMKKFAFRAYAMLELFSWPETRINEAIRQAVEETTEDKDWDEESGEGAGPGKGTTLYSIAPLAVMPMVLGQFTDSSILICLMPLFAVFGLLYKLLAALFLRLTNKSPHNFFRGMTEQPVVQFSGHVYNFISLGMMVLYLYLMPQIRISTAVFAVICATLATNIATQFVNLIRFIRAASKEPTSPLGYFAMVSILSLNALLLLLMSISTSLFSPLVIIWMSAVCVVAIVAYKQHLETSGWFFRATGWLVVALAVFIGSVPFYYKGKMILMKTPDLIEGVSDEKRAVPIFSALARKYWAKDILANRNREEVIPELVKALRYPDEDVKEMAADTLDELKWIPESSEEWMRYLYLKGVEDLERFGSEEDKTGAKAAAEALSTALRESTDPDIRVKVAWLLGRMGSTYPSLINAFPALTAALEDENEQVRSAAEEALVSIFKGLERSPGPEFLRFLKVPNSKVKIHAALVIAWTTTDETREENKKALIEALNGEDPEGRVHILKALGEIGGTDVLKILMARLEDENDKVRIAASSAVLVAIGSVEDKEALARLLDSEDGEIRRAAALCLDRQGGARSLSADTIASIMLDTVSTRLKAVNALSGLKDKRARLILISVLTDEDERVRTKALEALVGWCKEDPEFFVNALNVSTEAKGKAMIMALEPLIAKAAPEHFIDLLDKAVENNDRETVKRLEKLLVEHNPEALRGYKLKKAETELKKWRPRIILFLGSVFLAALAYYIVQKIKYSRYPEELIEILAGLQNEDPATRKEAAGRLSMYWYDDKRVVAPLIRALSDDDEDVRKKAAEALGRSESRRAVRPLIRKLSDRSWLVRMEAAIVLGRIRDKRAVRPLIRRLGDEDSPVVGDAAEALGKIGDRRAVKPLIKALPYYDYAGEATMLIAEALGNLGDPRAVKPLIKALSGDDSKVYQNVFKALGAIGDPSATQHLIDSLSNDKYKGMKYHMVNALGEIGDSRATETLVRSALEDESEVIRERATEAVKKINNPEAVNMFVEALLGSDKEKSIYAYDALMEVGDIMTCKLTKIFFDYDFEHMKSEISEIFRKGREEQVDFFVKLLLNENKRIREKVVGALGEIKDPRAVPALIKVLEDSDEDVCKSAIYALGEIGDPRALEGLKDMFGLHRIKIFGIREAVKKAIEKIENTQTEAQAEAKEKAKSRRSIFSRFIPLALLSLFIPRVARAGEVPLAFISQVNWFPYFSVGFFILGLIVIGSIIYYVWDEIYPVFSLHGMVNFSKFFTLIYLVTFAIYTFFGRYYINPGVFAIAISFLAFSVLIHLACLIVLVWKMKGVMKEIITNGRPAWWLDIYKEEIPPTAGLMGLNAFFIILMFINPALFTHLVIFGGILTLFLCCIVFSRAKISPFEEIEFYVSESAAGKIAAVFSVLILVIPLVFKTVDSFRSTQSIMDNVAKSGAVFPKDVRKERAAAILANRKPEEVVPEALANLDHADEAVREIAARTLCEVGWVPRTAAEKKKILEPIAGVLASDDLAYSLRMRAAFLLGETGSEEAIPHLKKALEDKDFSGSFIGPTAIEALGRIGGSEAVRLLVIQLSSREKLCREKAEKALSDILDTGRCSLADKLSLSMHPDKDIREHALKALGWKAETDPVDTVKGYLDHEDPHVVQAAVEFIGKETQETGDFVKVRTLLVGKLSSPDERVRAVAIRALRQNRSIGISEFLIKALSDESPMVRAQAAENLGTLRYGIPPELLIKLFSDKDTKVRVSAVRAATQIMLARDNHGMKAAEPFMPMLSDEDDNVRMAAKGAIGLLLNTSELESCLLSTNQDLQYAAAIVLAEKVQTIGIERLFEQLHAAMASPKWEYPAKAAFVRFIDKRLIINSDHLVRLVKMRCPDAWKYNVSEHAAIMLAERGDARGIDMLEKILSGEKRDFNRDSKVLITLSLLKNERAVNIMLKSAPNADELLRSTTRNMLVTMCKENKELFIRLLDEAAEKGDRVKVRKLESVFVEASPEAFRKYRLAMAKEKVFPVIWKWLKLGGLIILTGGIVFVILLKRRYSKYSAEVVKALAMLESEEPGVRVKAVASVASVNDPHIVEVFIKAFGDNDEFVVKAARMSFAGQIDTAEHFKRNYIDADFLLKVLDVILKNPIKGGISEISGVIVIIIEALGRRKSKKATRPLLDMLPKSEAGEQVVIAKALGEIGDIEALLPLVKLLNSKKPEIRDAAKEAIAKIKHSNFKEILINALSSPDKELRGKSTLVLAERKTREAVTHITKLLSDPELIVRMNAARALGEIGDVRAIDALRGAFADKETIVARTAVEALGEIGGPSAIDPLFEVASSKDQNLNVEALQALGKIKDPRAFDILIKALTLSDDLSFRFTAVQLLGELGNPKAIKPIGDIVTSPNTSRPLIKAAIEALGKIGGQEAIDRLQSFLSTRSIINVYAEDINNAAAEAIEKMEQDEAETPETEEIKEEGEEDTSGTSSSFIGGILSRLKSGFAVPLIVLAILAIFTPRASRAQEAPDDGRAPPVPAEVDEKTKEIDKLIEDLFSDDILKEHNAIRGLSKSGDPRALEALFKAYNDQAQFEIKFAIINFLESTPNVNADVLVKVLLTDDLSIRRAAIKALAKTRDEAAVGPIAKEVLSAGNVELRVDAAEALGEIGGPKAVDALIGALDDENLRVLWEAARALAKIKDPRAIEPLLKKFHEMHNDSRISSSLLTIIRSARDVEILIKVSSDPYCEYRKAAARALAKTKGEKTVKRLTELLSDEDEDVRNTAARALGKLGYPHATRTWETAAPSPVVLFFRNNLMWIGALAAVLGTIASIIREIIRSKRDPYKTGFRLDGFYILANIVTYILLGISALTLLPASEWRIMPPLLVSVLNGIFTMNIVAHLFILISAFVKPLLYDSKSHPKFTSSLTILLNSIFLILNLVPGLLSAGFVATATLSVLGAYMYISSEKNEKGGSLFISIAFALIGIIILPFNLRTVLKDRERISQGTTSISSAEGRAPRTPVVTDQDEEWEMEDLLEELGRSGNPERRWSIILSLGRYRDHRAVDAIFWQIVQSRLWLERSPDRNIDRHKESEESIIEIGRSTIVKLGETAVPALLHNMCKGDRIAVEESKELVIKIGPPAIPYLITAAEDSDWRMQRSALEVLVLMGRTEYEERFKICEKIAGDFFDDPALAGDKAFLVLLKVLNDYDKDKRAGAIRALGKIGNTAAIEPLVGMLSDQNEDVREAAIKALKELGKKGPEILIHILDKALKEGNRGKVSQLESILSESAPEKLREYKLERARRELLPKIKEWAPWVILSFGLLLFVFIAYVMYQRIKYSKYSSKLLELLVELEKKENLASTISKIGDLRDPRAIPFLGKVLLSSKGKSVRTKAAEALGKIKDRKAVKALIKALSDKDYEVRQSATNALGDIGDIEADEVLPHLRAMLTDSLTFFQAKKAIEKIRNAQKKAGDKPGPGSTTLYSFAPLVFGGTIGLAVIAVIIIYKIIKWATSFPNRKKSETIIKAALVTGFVLVTVIMPPALAFYLYSVGNIVPPQAVRAISAVLLSGVIVQLVNIVASLVEELQYLDSLPPKARGVSHPYYRNERIQRYFFLFLSIGLNVFFFVLFRLNPYILTPWTLLWGVAAYWVLLGFINAEIPLNILLALVFLGTLLSGAALDVPGKIKLNAKSSSALVDSPDSEESAGILAHRNREEVLVSMINHYGEYNPEERSYPKGAVPDATISWWLQRFRWENLDRTERILCLIARGERERIVQMGDGAVASLMEIIGMESGGNFHRIYAIRVLGEMDDKRAVGLLKKMLEDEDRDVRKAAVIALRQMGEHPVKLDERITRLIADRDWDSLVNIGRPAVKPLIEIIESDTDGIVRTSAVRALGKIKDPEAIPVLIRSLVDEFLELGRYTVRDAATLALHEMYDQAFPYLVRILREGEDDKVRVAVVHFLVESNNKAAIGPLVEVSDDANFSVSCSALGGLVKLGRTEYEAQFSIYHNVVKSNTEEVAKTGKDALPILLKALGEERYYSFVVSVLREMLVSDISAEPERLLAPKTIELIIAAMEAKMRRFSTLERKGGETIRSILGECCRRDCEPFILLLNAALDSNDSERANQLEQILSQDAPDKLREFKLARAKRDLLPKVKTWLPLIIGSFGVLLIVFIAYVVLQRIKYSKYPRDLLKALVDLKSGDKSTRTKGVQKALELKDERSIKPLSEILFDKGEEQDTRVGAAIVLGQIGSPKAIKYLKKALSDKNEKVKESAEAAIRWIKEAVDKKSKERKAKVKKIISSFIGRSRFLKILILTAILSIFVPRISRAQEGPAEPERGPPAPARVENMKERVHQQILLLAGENTYDDWKKAEEELKRMGPPVVDQLIKTLSSEDWKVRRGAAMGLMRVGDMRAEEALLKALDEENLKVLGPVIMALGKIKSQKAVDPILNRVSGKDSSMRFIGGYYVDGANVHAAANWALGEIGDPKAIDFIISTYRIWTDDKVHIQMNANIALGKIGEPAVMPLIKMLEDDFPGSRENAAIVLGNIGDPRAIEPLIRALVRGEYPCEQAIKALENFGEKAVAPLCRALSCENCLKSKIIAELLGKTGDRQAVDPLIEILYRIENNDNTLDLRKAIIIALGKIGDPKATNIVFEHLWLPTLSSYRETSNALKDLIDSPEGVNVIVMLWSEKSELARYHVRCLFEEHLPEKVENDPDFFHKAIAKALENGDKEGVKALESILYEFAPEKLREVRLARAKTELLPKIKTWLPWIVGSFGILFIAVIIYVFAMKRKYSKYSPELIEALAKLKSRDEDKQLEAFKILEEMDDPRAVSPLIDFVTSRKEFSLALDVLKNKIRRGHDISFKELLRIARISVVYPPLQTAVAELFGKTKDPREVSAIVDFIIKFKKSGKLIQDALGRKIADGDKIYFRDLIRLAKIADLDPSLKYVVATALGKTKKRKAVKVLIPMLSMPMPSRNEKKVKPAVARALGEIGDKRAVEPLISLLSEQSIAAQIDAARALAKIGDPRPLEALRALAAPGGSGSPTVQRAAEEAISQIEAAQKKKETNPPKDTPGQGSTTLYSFAPFLPLAFIWVSPAIAYIICVAAMFILTFGVSKIIDKIINGWKHPDSLNTDSIVANLVTYLSLTGLAVYLSVAGTVIIPSSIIMITGSIFYANILIHWRNGLKESWVGYKGSGSLHKGFTFLNIVALAVNAVFLIIFYISPLLICPLVLGLGIFAGVSLIGAYFLEPHTELLSGKRPLSLSILSDVPALITVVLLLSATFSAFILGSITIKKVPEAYKETPDLIRSIEEVHQESGTVAKAFKDWTVRFLANRNMDETIPELIKALKSDDPHVREVAFGVFDAYREAGKWELLGEEEKAIYHEAKMMTPTKAELEKRARTNNFKDLPLSIFVRMWEEENTGQDLWHKAAVELYTRGWRPKDEKERVRLFAATEKAEKVLHGMGESAIELLLEDAASGDKTIKGRRRCHYAIKALAHILRHDPDLFFRRLEEAISSGDTGRVRVLESVLYELAPEKLGEFKLARAKTELLPKLKAWWPWIVGSLGFLLIVFIIYIAVVKAKYRDYPPELLEAIIKLKSRDQNEQFDGYRSLKEMDDPRSFAPLIDFVKVRMEIGRDILRIMDEKIEKGHKIPFRELLRLARIQIRYASRLDYVTVAKVLGRTKDPRVVNVLIQMLSTGKEATQAAVAEALGEVGDKSAVKSLILLLGETSIEVRINAIRALAKIGDPRPLEFLRALTGPERSISSRVQRIAEEAIRQIEDAQKEAEISRDEPGPKGPINLLSVSIVAAVIAIFTPRAALAREIPQKAVETLTIWGVWGIVGFGVLVIAAVVYVVVMKWRYSKYPNPLLKALAELESSDPEVRREATVSLGKIKDLRAVPALIKALGDSDEIVRWSAAEFLGEIKDPRAVPALIKALKDNDEGVRWRAVVALGEIKDPSAVSALVEELGNSDKGVRWRAADALGKIKDKRAVPALVKTLGDSDEGVRRYAARALERIEKTQAGTETEQGKSTFLRLLPFGLSLIFISRAAWAREIPPKAAETFTKWGFWGLAVLGVLAVAAVVYVAVMKRKYSAYPTPLLGGFAGLKSTDYIERKWAAVALGKIGDKRAVPALLKAFKDRESSVREAAAEALGKIKDRRAVPALIKALRKKSNFDDNRGYDRAYVGRLAAAKALGEIGDLRGIEPLLERVINDNDFESIVESANDALIKLFESKEIIDPKYTDIVIKALFTGFLDSEKMHIAAVNTLAKMGDPKALEPLLEAIDADGYAEGIEELRSAAVVALGEIGDPKVVPVLEEALRKESYSSVKISLREVIAKLSKQKNEPAKGGRSTFLKLLVLGFSSIFISRAAWAREIPQKAVETLTTWGVWGLAVFGVLVITAVAYVVVMKRKYSEYSEPLIKTVVDIESDDSKVREKAARRLGEIKDIRGIDPLLKAILDERIEVKWAAVASLIGMISTMKDVDILVKMLEARKKYPAGYAVIWPRRVTVAGAAAARLGELKSTGAVKPLIEMLSDDNVIFRIAAAEALSEIGNGRAVPALVKMRESDPRKAVRAAAAKALEKIEKSKAEIKSRCDISILIGVTGKSEEDIYKINKNNTIGGVKVVGLYGTEEENLRTLNEEARKVGAYGQGIIDGKNLTVNDITYAIKGMIEAIEERDKRAFTLTDPSGVSLTDKEDRTIEEVLTNLREVTDHLPVIKWVGISEASVYNLKMTKHAARIVDGYVLEDRTKSLTSIIGEKGIMSVRADSLGELKMLAEAHRKRMNMSTKKLEDSPVRLSVRLVLESEDLEKVKKAGIQALLEQMDIAGAVKAEDVQIMTKEEADSLSAKDISDDIKTRYENTKDKNIVIVDKARKTRTAEEAEGIVLLEYEGSASARVYDIALELMAHSSEKGLDAIIRKVKELARKGKLWVILKPMKKVDTKELKDELDRYHEQILIMA